MEVICRVCLTSETGMLPLDETFIMHYNLLTNLNITLLDGMPQFSCKTCLTAVKHFIEFREKCIASEATLREILCSSLKSESKKVEVEFEDMESGNNLVSDGISQDNLQEAIKHEIKQEKEEDSDSILDNFVFSLEDFDGDLKDIVKDEDIKPKKRKKKNKKQPLKLNISQIIENNQEDEKLLCGICPKIFDEKTDLNNHIDTHKNDRQCEICKEKMNSFSQLLAHRLVHVSANQNKCHVCDKRFRVCLYLEHHYRTAHIKTDDPKLSCNICLLKFRLPKRLAFHMDNSHSSFKFYCNFCSKGFTNKSSLRSHIKHHNSLKDYVCDLCGFSCNYSSGLKDHKIRRHSQKKIYCKKCTRPFSSQQDHDKHKCKEKREICTICGIQLSGNSRLSRHMNRHSDIPKYECNRCPAKFKTKGALVAHLHRHDGNRTHQCEYCPAKFYTASVLIKHRRRHTGEKPYVCKVCNKGFTGGHNLKVHMKVHGEYLIVKKNTEPDLNNVTK